MMTREERQKRLAQLIDDSRECTACATMPGEPRALGEANGDVDARCLVVATAPGPRGAERTGIPLHGDRAGTSFERLLEHAGLRREHLFISNAVLCAPTDGEGRARKAREDELRNCSKHLSGLIVALDPKLVVTLGATALRALQQLAPHDVELAQDVGRPLRWMARWLLPLYHPGPRAMIHRSWAEQKRDYKLWKSLMED